MQTDELELAVREAMIRFHRDFMGESPKEIHVRIFNKWVLVLLEGVLTRAQQVLLETMPAPAGRDMIKSLRTHLIEASSTEMTGLIAEIIGVRVLSLHHDISTGTGEEVFLFTLARG